MARAEGAPGGAAGRGGSAAFFALCPPPPVATALQRLARSTVPPGARVVRAANLHLTLLYLGVLPLAREQRLCAAAAALEIPRFTLRLDRLGAFRRAGVLWSGPSVLPPELETLADGVRRAARGAGLDPEQRAFCAHVTLGRGLEQVPGAGAHPPISWTVDGFSLLRSCRDARGRVFYRCLCRWPPSAPRA